MVLLPKKTRRKLIRYFRSPSTPPDAAAAPAPRVALAGCFQRKAAASESCHASPECYQGSAVCCSAPAECCQGSAVCCSASAECCSLFCPYQVAFTEPPTLMNLLLGYPFNSRWFMDPLLARKDPVAGGCKYHHQVVMLSYPFKFRRFMDPLLARKDPVAGGCKYYHQVFIAELSL
jgi:hypothetical protein